MSEVLIEYTAAVSTWSKGHLSAISTAITTTILVIYGDDINGFVKKRIRGLNFVVRTGAFIALCAIGYGMLSVAGASAVARLLRYFGDLYLAPMVVGAFVLMGILAERKKYM
ncbi:MAG: DUF3392 domain-containing protein [Gemmatimonadetes bacterium]|jgi:hypothetical protein|nr:DUF3392 domain-containing protein [Gemmatimonadota bacterium]MBT6149237.1 DUF3392 domain-containing protein [Gemmatimonadota bacterium]MBT7862690.1 DUF3392 domain-containing protein [Gemmatimonadota bacterium]